jgi:hypothetical protein
LISIKEESFPGVMCMPGIPALGRLKQEGCQAEDSLDYTGRSPISKKKGNPHMVKASHIPQK